MSRVPSSSLVFLPGLDSLILIYSGTLVSLTGLNLVVTVIEKKD